jgi:iron complex outermembrane receptor protein
MFVCTSRSRWLLSAAMVTALGSALVHAQDTGAAASPDQYGVADIVVTAQKRSESLQRTAAAITALDGQSLVSSGTNDLRAVQNLVPAARFQPQGAATQVFLRGVGSNLDFGNVEPTVAFNINNIFVPREGTSQPLFDVEQIEVLPGPQGTLYGRNSLGGIINVSYKRPHGELETAATIEGGNYDLAHVTLVQNIPLSETFFARAAVDYTYRDGYNESGGDSRKDFAGRLSVLYQPASDFSVYLWGTGVKRDGHPPNLVNKGTDPATFAFREHAFLRDRPWDDLRPGALAATAIFGQPIAEGQTYDLWMGGGEIEIGLGEGLTLSYIPGYLSLNSGSRYWLGVIPAEKRDDYKLLTSELRLNGETDNLHWLLGVYGYRQKIFGDFFVGDPAGPFFFQTSRVDRHLVKGVSLFGEATYSLADTLRVTLGGRFSIDSRKANGVSSDVGNLPYTFSKSFRHFDYKAGVEYDIASNVMAYVTYQTGYQPGTFNEVPSTPAQSNLIQSPKLSAFTGGFKSRLIDNRLQLNVEAFHYSYKDLLIQAYDASKPYNEIFNASTRNYGAQADILFRPAATDQFRVAVAYLNARIRKYAKPGFEQFEGFSLPYSAEWTLNIAYHHDFVLASSDYIRVMGDARYESSWWADAVHTPGTLQKGVWRGNASITYNDGDGHWNFGVWIKNVSNEAVIAATAAAGIPGPATAYMEPPRTYGVRMSFNF